MLGGQAAVFCQAPQHPRPFCRAAAVARASLNVSQGAQGTKPSGSPPDTAGGGGSSLQPSAAAPYRPLHPTRKHPTFEQRCRQLELFRHQHGHTRVPMRDPSGLGAWVSRQRHAWKTGRLSASRQQQLAEVGFCPDAFQHAWSARFRQLALFHSQYGHCQVPYASWAERQYPGLYGWLQQQLQQWRQGTLPDDRRRRLQGLGVVFQVQESSWDGYFAQLLRFKEEYGHTDVPFQWTENPSLADWVAAQRQRWRGGSQRAPLTASQRSRLLSCGFVFDPRKDRWESRYAQLLDLKRRRGGYLLSEPLPKQGGLAAWANFQQQLWQQGKLAPERAAKLEALGLSCSTRPKHQWERRLGALDCFIATLGYPTAYTLLVLAPTSSAPAMAAAAAASCRDAQAAAPAGLLLAGGRVDEAGGVGELMGTSTAGESSGRMLSRSQAAAVVRWFHALSVSRLPQQWVQDLAARGLLLPSTGASTGAAAEGRRQPK